MIDLFKRFSFSKSCFSWTFDFSNVESVEIDLTEAYDTLYKKVGSINFEHSSIEQVGDFDFSMANTRSRLRMTTLYQFAGMCKMLVVERHL